MKSKLFQSLYDGLSSDFIISFFQVKKDIENLPAIYPIFACKNVKGPFIRSNKGNKYLLVITDQLSKFATLHPVRKANSNNVIKIFQEHFHMFGVPTTIIEDNGSNLISKQVKNFLESFKVNLMNTPRYHPQANPTERVNRRMR